MSLQILFRSTKSRHNKIGNSTAYIQSRGSNWSHLRPYTDMDDIRDIAWKKMKPEGLSVRTREDTGIFDIITYWEETPYDEFFIEDNPALSKKEYIKKSKDIIRQSAEFGGYNYQEYHGINALEKLIQKKPKNTLLFICNSPIDNTIKSLAHHNDLIYLDITHPFESNPDENTMFLGKVLNIKKYKNVYNLFKDSQKNTIKSIKGSYIPVTTQDNISDILNTFFKKRYKNG